MNPDVKASLTEFRQQMRSDDLLVYLSLNRSPNNQVSFSLLHFFQFQYVKNISYKFALKVI